MSKKMKRVASGSSPYGLTHPHARDVSKHQTLLEEFQELQKETEAMRSKMEFMKQRKSTLSAEVRFLRRRYKYLLETKSSKPLKGKELVQQRNLTTKNKNVIDSKPQRRKADVIQKAKVSVPKARRDPSPVLDLNQKVRMLNEKETSSLRNTAPMFVEKLVHGEKEASFRSPNSILDLNHQGIGYSRREDIPRRPALAFDLNEVQRAPMRREDVVQSRAPIFDLNQTVGEEELDDSYEPLQSEGQNSILSVRNRTDEEQNDLKLLACRNAGTGSSRTGKRKISWQDQMALHV